MNGWTKLKLVLRDLYIYWNITLIVLVPLVLLPLPLIFGTLTARCSYVVLIMAIYWMTEALPLAVTAFIPVVAYPLLGVASVKDVCSHYLRDSNFLFMGGLIMAVAVEESGLHERLALRVLLLMGSEPKWLLFGFMMTTGFLSMWMNNTATTAMMLPIALAVSNELLHYYAAAREIKQRKLSKKDDATVVELNMVKLANGTNEQVSMPVVYKNDDGDDQYQSIYPDSIDQKEHNVDNNVNVDKQHQKLGEGSGTFDSDTVFKNAPIREQRIAKMLLISLCYAANIGGTGTLTGTVPNLVLMGILETYYRGKNVGVTFASWLEFNTIPMWIALFLSWVALQVVYLGFGSLFSCKKQKGGEDGVSRLLQQKHNALGPMSFAEKAVLFWFLVLVLLWIFRQPEMFPGWSYFFNTGFTSDAIAAMLISMIMFIFPKERPDFLCYRKDPFAIPSKRQPLMTWSAMQQKFPWSVIMLLGGGFAMADGVQKSGLSDILAEQLASLNFLPTLVLLLIVMTTVVFITEFTSNVATASIFVPLGITLANGFCVNPLYFALPITLASSYAFMLPVATPPNAIVFSAGRLKVWDMIICGFLLNFVCIFVTLLNMNTVSYWLFDLGTFPDWGVARTNNTCVAEQARLS